MTTIRLKDFGIVLVSRPAGAEAFNAIRPTLEKDTGVDIDFDGVITVTPSWLDEFLMHLAAYMEGRVELLPTTNASVLMALPVLAEARQDDVALIVKRALVRMEKQ